MTATSNVSHSSYSDPTEDCGPAEVIRKPGKTTVNANLIDYESTCRDFDWASAAGLDRRPGGGLNMAHEAVDRHVNDGLGDRVALRFLPKEAPAEDVTFRGLAEQAARFADVLDRYGVDAGESVFTLVGRTPGLYAAVLGALKRGAVVCPLFSAFGPEPIRQRLTRGNGKVLVTTASLYRTKIAPIRESLPDLAHVFVIGGGADPPDTIDLDDAMAAASPTYPTYPTTPESPALLHFTSGTTGTPKGAVHVHRAVTAHAATARLALDLHPDDVYWCTADPGWVTGMSYGIIAPLVLGLTSVVDEAEFDARRWYRTLQDQRITVWYTAPTAIRRLMKAGDDLAGEYDLSALRFAGSVGEPLNPEGVRWGQSVLGVPFHDNWWQTETGGIMIANFAAMDIRPGSMGRPMPGIDVGLLEYQDGALVVPDGRVQPIDQPRVEGMLALRPGWPSMFRGYLHEPDRYEKCFVDGWYISGDLAWRDADGYYWFVGRADDVIKSSGHLIGPFEVESALMEHPAVVEAGVFGVPDPIAGEIVRAHVALRPGFEPGESLRRDLLAFARTRLGPAVAPRIIEFEPQLPKTKSGKIMRRLLRARCLGLPEGDTSTLEEG